MSAKITLGSADDERLFVDEFQLHESFFDRSECTPSFAGTQLNRAFESHCVLLAEQPFDLSMKRCPRRDLNSHDPYRSADFKSDPSTDSGTRAMGKL